MHLVLLILLILSSILAILLRDLLKAALSLMLASIFLAMIFFSMDAPYAGVFEISVVAGLITVLFISTIGLTRSEGDVRESKLPLAIFPLFFIWFIIIDILVMNSLLNAYPAVYPAPETGTFGQVFWQKRTFDLVGQIGVIFAGVFCILALFRKRDKHD
ncbi:MAG: NADH-quinone oxidoreductase subunit J [bacterium]